jgi:hypothetical protein
MSFLMALCTALAAAQADVEVVPVDVLAAAAPAALAAPAAPVDPVAAVEPAPVAASPTVPAESYSFAAVPTLVFNTDDGFGTGGVISIYHQADGLKPFHDELRFNIFISTKLIQAHAITWDGLRPFGLPGRVFARLRYYSTVSQNYCGVGSDVDCNPADAGAEATSRGLTNDDARADDAHDTFARRYYLMRFIRPEATLLYRHWLRDKPWRTELLVGWRGSYTVPGAIDASGPYPGSRYAEDFPNGEPGLSSVPILGVVVDDRDDEVFPTRGVFAEASLRASHAFTGSAFEYGGATAIGAAFFSVTTAPRVVLAARFIADVMVGAPSTEEMARIGGTLDSIAFGGAALGRGIREHRYLGKVKFMNQTELRAQLYDVVLAGQDLSFGTALFSDSAIIGYDFTDWRGNPLEPLITAGVSARVIWNKTFAVRADLATSPNEANGPGFYIIVGQPF